ncbi:hypothetical protein GCM10009087_30420 [Sphingomonas oligophenolica]|uniref:Ribbon-helix-helix protein, CopG family n=1 Tax=Sphingomonas oligophenolica TaxID=301154 RepID=A0ABU9Y6G5_9SPHN
MASTFNEIMPAAYMRGMGMAKSASAAGNRADSEVPLQITVPPKVKRAIDLKSVETGRTRRALVLEALRGAGIEITDDDIAGRRGGKK